jgi:5-methylcytosine-specific restriction endonuclease McrA
VEKLRPKRPRLALSREEYDRLRIRVLERDRWKCQRCGSSVNLQVHHLRYRGRLGSDALDNLISLCIDWHNDEHQKNNGVFKADGIGGGKPRGKAR